MRRELSKASAHRLPSTSWILGVWPEVLETMAEGEVANSSATYCSQYTVGYEHRYNNEGATTMTMPICMLGVLGQMSKS